MPKLVLIAHNIRSTHNVGSLLRTADGLGIEKVYLTGYTPFPVMKNDPRLPHIARKMHNAIHKTALGAEDSIAWEHNDELSDCLSDLKQAGFLILALEQADSAIEIDDFHNASDLALMVGNERDGLQSNDLDLADKIIQIPMAGKKESFNVSVAAAMALYHLKNLDT